MMMTEGNPVDYAKTILAQEEKPFEQFAIGFEGYLRDKGNNRVDSIVVQAFDVTQDKGVILGQMFNPKENGGFRKIDKMTFLGHADLIIDKKHNPTADYSTEPAAVTGFSVNGDEGNKLKYVVAFVHDKPSVVANEIKFYIRDSFSGEKRSNISGQFELNILNVANNNADFLTFLVTNALNEELESASVKSWCSETGRAVQIVVKHDEQIIYDSSKNNNPSPAAEAPESGSAGYEQLTNEQLDDEFYRIVSIPNARTNITALTQMSALMKEYKNRGLEMPAPGSKPASGKKWWQFWK
jgi:hypothetical protein